MMILAQLLYTFAVALELMDEFVSDDGAWLAMEGGEAAHCGEQLILLVQGITDRYKRLPQPGHRYEIPSLMNVVASYCIIYVGNGF